MRQFLPSSRLWNPSGFKEGFRTLLKKNMFRRASFLRSSDGFDFSILVSWSFVLKIITAPTYRKVAGVNAEKINIEICQLFLLSI